MAKEAGNAFLSSFFKFIINALFGRLCQAVKGDLFDEFLQFLPNLRRDVTNHFFYLGRKGARFIRSGKKLSKILASPYYASSQLVNNNLCQVLSYPTAALLNQPLAQGVAILEIARHRMVDFWYNVVKRHFKNDVKLLYSGKITFHS